MRSEEGMMTGRRGVWASHVPPWQVGAIRENAATRCAAISRARALLQLKIPGEEGPCEVARDVLALPNVGVAEGVGESVENLAMHALRMVRRATGWIEQVLRAYLKACHCMCITGAIW